MTRTLRAIVSSGKAEFIRNKKFHTDKEIDRRREANKRHNAARALRKKQGLFKTK